MFASRSTNANDGGSTIGEGFDYRRLLPGNNGTRNDNDVIMAPEINSPNASSNTLFSMAWLNRSDQDVDIESNNNTNNESPFFCSLSWRERLLGSLTCLLAGMLLNVGTCWFRWYSLQALVLNTTLANLMSLLGSLFWTGPTAQCTRMWQPQRRSASLLYLGSLAITLFVVSVKLQPMRLYLIILLPCQSLSITWYTLSYIPYAHEAVKSFVSRRILANSNN